MILFDTETTNLVGADALAIEKQPRIFEICAIRLDDKTLVETAMLDTYIAPGAPITPEAEKITGVKNSDLAGAKPFAAHVDAIADFFLGERWIVAHNAEFDMRCLEVELRRLDRVTRFPWPPQRLCTVEASFHIQNRRLKLGELYEIATGRKMTGAHKAINDTRGMAECLRWLVSKKKVSFK